MPSRDEAPSGHAGTAVPTIVTVGIKALNEELRIAETLASALRATEPLGGEVILADSGSTDRTIEIARQFSVRVFQLADPSERCCGAGAQLAFQHARGKYFYLLDGDMVLDAAFLRAGIAYLEAHADVAAVGGLTRECNIRSEEFQIRAAAAMKDESRQPGQVDRLDGGGLYRSDVVRALGYFGDRNLHAFEEFDLAARLQSRGWKLARIDHVAVDHYGHDAGGYALMWRRLRSGYAGGSGEVVRGAVSQAHFPFVLSHLKQVRYGVAVIIWWCALILSLWVSPMLLFAAFVVPVAFLSFRRGSLHLGFYSLASWNVNALGLITGFLRHRVPADTPIASVNLSHTD